MNKIKVWTILATMILTTSFKNISEIEKNKIPFDFDWKFALGDHPEAYKSDYNDSGWRQLDVPHDYSIEQPFDSLAPSGGGGGYAFGGIGWYRKHFVLDKNLANQKVSILFNGVYRNSEVWINGNYLGCHPYGYTSFFYDITPYLNPTGQDNILAVKVNTSEQPNSRWYTGSGIYRHVWLQFSGKVHFEQWGIFAQTRIDEKEKAKIDLAINVINEEKTEQNCEIQTSLLNAEGKKIASTSSQVVIQAGDTMNLAQTLEPTNVKLWSVDNPYLYRLQVKLKSNGKSTDSYSTPYGIRTFKFNPNIGFLLNGKHIKLKGTNNHHDGGSLGAASMDYTFVRQLRLLKEMGCNALRMSHNPPAPELLDVADSLGFVVIDEIFDEWMDGKTAAGYSSVFEKWNKKDVEDWIKRDRNHPSIIAWSIGNEVKEQWHKTEGPRITKILKAEVLKFDTTRPITMGANGITGINANGMGELLDIVGYNYEEAMYEIDHHTYPKRVIFGSETLQYPYHPGKWDQFRSYKQWLAGQTEDYVVGEFIWTGFDYLGEAGIGEVGDGFEFWKIWPGWPSRGASCGLFDICGFQNEGYWFRRALWTDEPIVHIAVETDPAAKNRDACSFWAWPKVAHHWNHPTEGDTLTVQVYTNVPEVELKLNGKSLGIKHWKIDNEAFLVWNIPFKKGILETIGKLPDGRTVTDKVETAGHPYKVQLIADRKSIKANKQDLCYVKAILLDEKGIPVPFADNEIEFELIGAGKLNAVGNGDLKNNMFYKSNKTKAFKGKCLAIVQSSDKVGKIVLKAHGIGLVESQVIINCFSPN